MKHTKRQTKNQQSSLLLGYHPCKNSVWKGIKFAKNTSKFDIQRQKTLDLSQKWECANLIEQDKAFLERLRILKDKSGMTTKQIAEKCNIPESTVTRIFAGKTPNPTIITIMNMTKSMGGTAADIFDDNAQINTNPTVPKVVVTDLERQNEEIKELYKDIVKAKDKTIKMLTYVLLGVALFALGLAGFIALELLVDLFGNGIVG